MILQHQTDGYFDHAAENLHKRGRQDAGRKEGVSGANIAIEFILRRNMNSPRPGMFRWLLILTFIACLFVAWWRRTGCLPVFAPDEAKGLASGQPPGFHLFVLRK
jgi:hypothetical protein